MNYNRLFTRSVLYLKRAYSVFSIPFQFISYSTTIYYLMIDNISFLKNVFPNFIDFLKISFLLIIVFVITGYIWTKKTKMTVEDIEIQAEINPYSIYKITKVQIPFYTAIIELLKKHNIDTSNMEKILENSK